MREAPDQSAVFLELGRAVALETITTARKLLEEAAHDIAKGRAGWLPTIDHIAGELRGLVEAEAEARRRLAASSEGPKP